MSIAANIEKTEERIEKACLRSGRKREEITLMAVSKFMPLEAVLEAQDAGIRCFGESRVQEAVTKFSGLVKQWQDTGRPIQLHLIGGLQRNKAKLASSFFDCIQSLDRMGLADELAKHAKKLPVLLELRTGEETKSGFANLDELFYAAESILACPSLRIHGLMTMAPNVCEETPVRSAFRQLAEAKRELEKRFPFDANSISWSCLSMGMSGDFEIAIEEGSTMLRIGSAIFDDRE